MFAYCADGSSSALAREQQDERDPAAGVLLDGAMVPDHRGAERLEPARARRKRPPAERESRQAASAASRSST
jgi:hypothetical protein